MSAFASKLTKIKSRYKVVENWQTSTTEYKLINNYYRNYGSKKLLILPSKVRLILFAYIWVYRSKFSKIYRGSHISVISDDGLTVLNTSNQNPNDFNFRGQLIRMELPLISYHTNVTWEIYFEKIPQIKKKKNKLSNNVTKKTQNKTNPKPVPNDNKDVFVKASIVGNSSKNDSIIRIKIANFSKFISMNMENDASKTLIIELDQNQVLNRNDIDIDNDDDDKSDFSTDNDDDDNSDNSDSDYDPNDPRYTGFSAGDPFITTEYYFVGIISNLVSEFDTDTNNYHLDGYGIDSARDYIYDGAGNNVIDTEELNQPWSKPSILNLDVVKVECNMNKKTLTMYRNGVKFGPKNKDYTISFDHYGIQNKTWYPAICIVNKNVKAVFKYLD